MLLVLVNSTPHETLFHLPYYDYTRQKVKATLLLCLRQQLLKRKKILDRCLEVWYSLI